MQINQKGISKNNKDGSHTNEYEEQDGPSAIKFYCQSDEEEQEQVKESH
jgi:hypothetical protein